MVVCSELARLVGIASARWLEWQSFHPHLEPCIFSWRVAIGSYDISYPIPELRVVPTGEPTSNPIKAYLSTG